MLESAFPVVQLVIGKAEKIPGIGVGFRQLNSLFQFRASRIIFFRFIIEHSQLEKNSDILRIHFLAFFEFGNGLVNFPKPVKTNSNHKLGRDVIAFLADRFFKTLSCQNYILFCFCRKLCLSALSLLLAGAFSRFQICHQEINLADLIIYRRIFRAQIERVPVGLHGRLIGPVLGANHVLVDLSQLDQIIRIFRVEIDSHAGLLLGGKIQVADFGPVIFRQVGNPLVRNFLVEECKKRHRQIAVIKVSRRIKIHDSSQFADQIFEISSLRVACKSLIVGHCRSVFLALEENKRNKADDDNHEHERENKRNAGG